MARLDTGWHANTKVIALPWQGIALHAWSISYCDAQRTDGFIPDGAWWSKRGSAVGVKALVAAGMWEPAAGGYQLHDYTVYNKTRAKIEAEQAEDRERKRTPDSGRNPAGKELESGDDSGRTLARVGAPGPGPLVNELAETAAAAAPSGATPARTRTRTRAKAPTPTVLSPELLAEHERYLARERAAAAAAANSISSNGGRRG